MCYNVLNLGHQLAKGKTCGDGRRWNARYMNANKTEVDHQLISPMTFRLISLYMGSPLLRIYAIIYCASKAPSDLKRFVIGRTEYRA